MYNVHTYCFHLKRARFVPYFGLYTIPYILRYLYIIIYAAYNIRAAGAIFEQKLEGTPKLPNRDALSSRFRRSKIKHFLTKK